MQPSPSSIPRFCLLSVLIAAAVAPPAQAADLVRELTGFTTAAMDPSVKPCQDFYQHACGGWLKTHPIPGDQTAWSQFHELSRNNMAVLSSILDRISRNEPSRRPSERKIGDYFDACMDEPRIEARGTEPLRADLAALAAVQDRADLARLVARLHETGVNALFKIGAVQDFKDANRVIAGITQGGTGLPSRDDYFQTDAGAAEIRTRYAAHIRRMLELVGDTPEAAEAGAQAVLRLETALAGGSLTPVQQRDPVGLYHPVTWAELARLTPSFDWNAYVSALGAAPFERANVAAPAFLEAMERQLRSAPLDEWKSYLRWRLVNGTVPVLPAAFVNEDFEFFHKTLSGATRPVGRWLRCFRAVDADLGELLGQVYVDTAFSEESRRRVEAMTAAIVEAMERDLRELDWMSDVTRKAALDKLSRLETKLGYPKTWRDYGPLRIERGDAYGNRQRSKGFELRRQLAKIGKPADRGEWISTPPTVNAHYEAQRNEIIFPAGILQPPFFDPRLDDAANLGALGVVLGHEITHGFDDEGRHFDGAGNLRDWWTERDARAFSERTACLVEQFAGYTAVDGTPVDGKLTLGENTADLGGLRLAYMALQQTLAGKERTAIDGLTPEQRLFLSFGQIYCENRRPESERKMVLTNPHSPGRFRVNGVVANMPEFAQAFGCKAGQPMVREKVCRVW